MKLKSVDLSKIQIKDHFWTKHVELVKDIIIPYQWEAMNDRIEGAESSHCLENFKIAAGRASGEFYGAVFQDTDIAKWLEAVGFTLSNYKDKELEKTADEVIDLIAEAQDEDGYLNTYFTIKEPDKRWKNLCEGHELYTAGHFMEAAVAYYYGTGKEKLLKCVMRFADLICNTFGGEEGKLHGYPGHQEVEIGLVKLYEVSGNKKYLEMAKYFIEERGKGENYFLKEMKEPGFQHIFPEFHHYDTKYSQSHMPVRLQKTAEGHAVRAVYMYCAMADLAEAYQDAELFNACKTLWNNITQKRMYVTGSIGSSGILERFTTDYDLPNDNNYSETCASIGLALFGLRMGNMTRDGAYLDVVEKALYNTVLAGIGLDGKSFFYVNPLEVWPESCIDRTSKEHVKPIRQKWFGVACCPPNIARTLASLGQYIYGISEDSVYVHLFVSNETEIVLNNQLVTVKMETRFPYDNEICLQLKNVPKEGINMAVRIPEYAKNYKVEASNETLDHTVEKGYGIIRCDYDMEIKITFEAPARYLRANPKVRADAGKVAISRGPLIYCFEEADNKENLSAVYVDTDEQPEEIESSQLGEILMLEVKGKRIRESGWGSDELYSDKKVLFEGVKLKAIPYCYWSNRRPGEMSVWMKEWIH